MTEQSTNRHGFFSLKNLLSKILNFLLKIRIHLFILIFTVAYLAFVPRIIAQYSGKLGEPIESGIVLPSPSDKILNSLDDHQVVEFDNQELQQLVGWAFLQEETDQGKFDKYLVLHSKYHVYLYQYGTIGRTDVQAYFKNLGLDLLNSGYQALISADSIESGSYNIGFLFSEKSGQSVYYSRTNYFLKRTPNSVSIDTGSLP